MCFFLPASLAVRCWQLPVPLKLVPSTFNLLGPIPTALLSQLVWQGTGMGMALPVFPLPALGRGLCSSAASSAPLVLGLVEAQSWRRCPNLCNFLSNKAALWQSCCPTAALLPGSHSPAHTSPAPLPELLPLV